MRGQEASGSQCQNRCHLHLATVVWRTAYPAEPGLRFWGSTIFPQLSGAIRALDDDNVNYEQKDDDDDDEDSNYRVRVTVVLLLALLSAVLELQAAKPAFGGEQNALPAAEAPLRQPECIW